MNITIDNSKAQRVFDELRAYNDQFTPKVNYEPVTFSAESSGEFLGGLEGFKAWDHFEISNMVVIKRGQGIGRALLAEVEVYCRRHGLTTMVASTMDFQAPGFYEACGFEKFGEVAGFAGKHTCHYYVKRL